MKGDSYYASYKSNSQGRDDVGSPQPKKNKCPKVRVVKLYVTHLTPYLEDSSGLENQLYIKGQFPKEINILSLAILIHKDRFKEFFFRFLF